MTESNKPLIETELGRVLTMTEVVDDSKTKESLTLARILMIAPSTISVVIGVVFIVSINSNYNDDESGLTWLFANTILEIIFGISIVLTIICLIIGAAIAHQAKKSDLG